ncbi:acid protease [Dendrothele bispora CBS 962.96]|uniref:Acid protease n=1 Tax=Dendrothele bispora (strain CBS 962.96) TaxID=1314807 RepID=A0A4S8MYS9_DENBC|nr:acid protease [Dendrothele bispora CBS 962.96]
MNHYVFLLLFSFLLPSFAVKFSVKQQSSSTSNFRVFAASQNNTLDINTARDLIYLANITIGGTVYPIQLDTGSSDLWVQGTSFPLSNSSTTNIAQNVTYGIGWAYGNVSYATVEFAEITVDSQAFLDVSQAQNPALSYGANGILGLGFTSLSTIDALVNSTGSGQGRSLLYNLFQDNPSEPNFIAFALQRTSEDQDGDVEGSFSIGEYEPAYASVADTAAIPTWPETSPKRWSVLVEALMIGDKTVTPTTNVPDVPSNRAVAVLDTGTSYTYVSEEICNAIYGGISGAQFDETVGQWIVPCNAEIDMAIQIGGRIFPLHPLDITPKSLGSTSTCVGSFVPQTFASSNQFDWLVGDNVLRSVYSIYDFGDFDSSGNMGNPYVKLLALTNPDEASADFAQARGTTAKTGITYNASNETAAAAASTSVTLSTDVAETLAKIGQYFPAIIGVIALNALVLLAILVVGIVLLCQRRKKKSAKTRSPIGRSLTPMPMNRDGMLDGAPMEPHSYEPVSMAMTEDTMFVPPSPAFRKSFGSPLKGDNRPKSVANLPSHKIYDISEDSFEPPSPGFKEYGRPKSVGVFGVQGRPSTSSSFQPLNGPTPEDEPFVPPRSPRAPSIRSFHSQQSGGTPTEFQQGAAGIPLQDFPGGPEMPEVRPPLREATTLSGVTLMDVPLPHPRSPFRGENRPMSAGYMPTTEFVPPNAPMRRVPVTEEDIALAPPNPSFLRPGAGEGSADRPRSVA